MASKRTCDRCGGASSPHIPRKRAADGRMLCQGCMDVSARELKTTAAAGPGDGKGAWKGKKSKPEQADFWEGELGQEGVHPLQAALPNSVWEKYNKHRELMGKDLLSPEHYAEAETPQGDSDPVHQEQPPEQGRKRRLWRRKKSSSLGKTAAEMPEPHDTEALKKHLVGHHPIADWEMDLLGNDHNELKGAHDDFHHNIAYSGDNKASHEHPEVGPEGESSAGGHSHGPMTSEEMEAHLLANHALKPSGVQHIKDGDHAGGGGSPSKNMEDWHHDNHDYSTSVKTGVPHDHGGKVTVSDGEGPEELKHPTKYSVSSLHSHLLEDHGIDPDHMENAANGSLEGVHPSHVTTMLHDQMHKAGKAQHPHTHQHYSGGPDLHEGHMDVGKPFWGSPPDHDVQKNLSHLTAPKSQGGHGLFPSQVAEMAGHPMDADDDEANAAYSNLHGNLHKTGHGDHQHIPTAQKVKTPAQLKKEQLQQHLKDFHGITNSFNPQMDHGIAHDSEAYGYKGSPNHEHPAWDAHGPVTQSLGQPYQGSPTSVPYKPTAQPHASTMSKQELEDHLLMHHHKKSGGDDGGDEFESGANSFIDHLLSTTGNSAKSHEELLQEHALKHTTGETNGHAHDPVAMHAPLDGPDEHYGHEPEVQTKTHPAIDNDSDALAHIIQHHPNVSTDDYSDWSKGAGAKPTMVGYHKALHTPGSKTALGNTLPKVIDGHDHAEPSGPPTTIAVGSHLVHEHGMDQADVAKMSPAEFKAHHEVLHAKTPESDIGHGHDYPGGPQRDPRMHLPNTHHEMMRDDSKHPACEEWYHGTGTDYEGAPKNATELQEGHGFWGNYGGGDWNNHVGTHWTSLHQMAQNFGGTRVIHAKLHIKNPITYNSLNHMSHDAYDRLRASGHMQDDGAYENNHDDDNGYNTCCSDRLLEYAKGHHRDDGKYGVEAYRDSLRASGHDGIKVRNQADSPSGHWNAVPLSADQIEITNGGCRGTHGDERDSDNSEFNSNRGKTLGGWQHPKPFKNKDYQGNLGHLPEDHEVSAANAAKKQAPLPHKTAEGRGDSDPLRNGRNLGGSGNDFGDGGNSSHYCDHCDEQTNHETEDCTTSKWCSVCGENGDHTTDEGHEWCEHCHDYGEHDTEDHQDEYGEKPDEMRKEGYCPHCDQSTKENYNSDTCKSTVTKTIDGEKKQVECGKKLPDWGKLTAFGKPVKDDEYATDGEHEPKGDELDTTHYGPASEAQLHPSKHNAAAVAAHLYHHHGSDVSGKEFEDKDESWHLPSLNYHHQYLHQNPQEAESRGFSPVSHSEKGQFGNFKAHGAMSPEEIHAHLMLGHAGTHGGGSGMSVKTIAAMTPEEAVAKHKQMHEADDAVPWGSKDEDGDLKPKITHSHNAEATPPLPGMGPDPKFAPKGDDLIEHLGSTKHFGPGLKAGTVGELLKKSPATAEALHQQAHDSYGPSAEPHEPKFHVHDESSAKAEANQEMVKGHLINDHGADPGHHKITGASTTELMELHHNEHAGNLPHFGDPDHNHFGGTAHMNPKGHSAETMKKSPKPEGKTSSRRTLSDLFEEVAA